MRGNKEKVTNIKQYAVPSKDEQKYFVSNLRNNHEIRRYLNTVKGLNNSTLKIYGVGLSVYNDEQCITFPWSSNNIIPLRPCRMKVYPVRTPTQTFLDPPDGMYGLFGYHTIPSDYIDTIVLTIDEIDAMSIYQETGIHALSLPNAQYTLPIEVLPLLERFKVIKLWLPQNSGANQERSETFARKLGIHRTYIVKCTLTANDSLLKKLNLQYILNSSSRIKHKAIETFSDLRDKVLYEIRNPDMYSGVPIKSLPRFTDILKGFRRGELTVLTGPTGSGKTTLLGQLSVDIAEQGINTLWGSFEIKNTRLLQKLLHQYARYPLPTIHDSKSAIAKLEHLANQFESLPLHFLKFHGGSDIHEVLDAIEYASYVHDVEHVILDNMQFMLSTSKQRNMTNKFDIQDDAISIFRKFASTQNVHVILVVHPRKEHEETQLGISSVFGGAKATQEADSVLILQYNGRKKWIDVKKNRYDGTLGTCPLYFSGKTGRYTDNVGFK